MEKVIWAQWRMLVDILVEAEGLLESRSFRIAWTT
jgi:hypothetical protein